MVDTDDVRRTADDGRRTTPRVWHKFPTGELKTDLRTDLHKERAHGADRVCIVCRYPLALI